ncbi:MAG: cytochrome c, partial [Methylococcales bacterium]|nr:cytochrome c [Methylococcales bacterium]
MKKTIIKLNQSIWAGAVSLLTIMGSVQASSDMHTLYQDNCASCHGSDHGGYLAPALNSETLKGRSPTALRSLIMTGSFETLMPPFYG